VNDVGESVETVDGGLEVVSKGGDVGLVPIKTWLKLVQNLFVKRYVPESHTS